VIDDVVDEISSDRDVVGAAQFHLSLGIKYGIVYIKANKLIALHAMQDSNQVL